MYVTKTNVRLNKDTAKRNQSQITDSKRQARLKKNRQSKKQARKVSQPPHEINKQEYLKSFDDTKHGGIEKQCWAKANMNNFYKSVQYIVSQCTTCWEAWPLKSKPRSPYVCSRCFKDKKSPRKFSLENSMIPSSIPDELQNLIHVEKMLITRALPIMQVYIKPGGQSGYLGDCITNLPQNLKELAKALPRYPKDLAIIIVKVKGKDNKFNDVTVRKQKVHNALLWLKNNNPHYSEVLINDQALNSLPENGVQPELMTVETNNAIVWNRAYWNRVRDELKAITANVGAPTLLPITMPLLSTLQNMQPKVNQDHLYQNKHSILLFEM